MPGSNEWGQFYHENFMDGEQIATTILPVNCGGFSDATILTTTSTVVTESVSSPGSSYSGGQLTPTGSVAKPIRRRSRVSKKTPITLLNANANNFRALVQQFTGCATSSSPISFGTQKGPINLSFGPNTVTNNSSLNAPFGSHNYSYQYQQQLQRVAQPPLQIQQQPRQPLLQLPENQEFHQEQQRMYPIDNASGNGHNVFQYSSSSASGNYNPAPSTEVMDGAFVMDQEDIALHEFSRDLFSN